MTKGKVIKGDFSFDAVEKRIKEAMKKQAKPLTKEEIEKLQKAGVNIFSITPNNSLILIQSIFRAKKQVPDSFFLSIVDERRN